MIASRLKTEYLVNPMGIDIQHPRLQWTCEGGVKQTAYQIVTEKWDSGKAVGDSMCAYYPQELASGERVNWKIRLWDENDEPGEWSEAFFEMGLLSPSDCPTRERMGWTGDSQVFFGTASYLADYAAFARKHLRDVFDRQWKNGKLPQIAPYANEDWFMNVMNGSVGWADVGILMPYRFYKKYGDRQILKDNFENMLLYAAFMISRCGKWGGIYAKPLGISKENRKYAVNAGQSYGEWAEPNDVKAFVWTDFAEPHPEESTAYTAWVLGVMVEICDILGRNEYIPRLKEYSEGAKKAYQEMVSKPKFTLDTDRQAKLVRPLYMNLLNEEQTEFAKKRLIRALDNYGWRLGTGFLSTPMILYVLADMDIEYAYRLLENEEIPGWLSMPKSGAMTIWEAWEGPKGDAGIASLNHYSKGAVCKWLFDTCCGIQVEWENRFVVAPRPGGHLDFAKASYDSIYGTIESGWEKKDGETVFTVTVPANCEATVRLPDGSERVQQSGTMTYAVQRPDQHTEEGNSVPTDI